MPLRLDHELAIWRRAWRTPILWWRDDDCRQPTWRLDRLLNVSAGLPMTLAVIPDQDLKPLARHLEDHKQVSIAQHGVDHENRLPIPGPRSEFPRALTQEQINTWVQAGRNRLSAAGLEPHLFVPPWNEADDRLITAISSARYATYSIGIYGEPRGGLDHVGAQVDVLRWKHAPRFRGRSRILEAMRLQLEKRRLAGRFDEPIGLLTHHLDHDEETWQFLEWFVAFSKGRFDWRPITELCPAATGAAALSRRKIAVA
jgi:hypothetical protein